MRTSTIVCLVVAGIGLFLSIAFGSFLGGLLSVIVAAVALCREKFPEYGDLTFSQISEKMIEEKNKKFLLHLGKKIKYQKKNHLLAGISLSSGVAILFPIVKTGDKYEDIYNIYVKDGKPTTKFTFCEINEENNKLRLGSWTMTVSSELNLN